MSPFSNSIETTLPISGRLQAIPLVSLNGEEQRWPEAPAADSRVNQTGHVGSGNILFSFQRHS